LPVERATIVFLSDQVNASIEKQRIISRFSSLPTHKASRDYATGLCPYRNNQAKGSEMFA
jgi:hypothetical protein